VPDVPWAAAFVLGAIVSPPDAVAVTAILHRLRLPPRIIAIIEGESLVNDATAIILYKFALAALLTGAFSAGDAVVGFVVVAVGGTAVGLAWAGLDLVHKLLKDTLSEDDAVPGGTLRELWAGRVPRRVRRARGDRGRPVACIAGPLVLSAETRQHTFGMWDAVVFFLNAWSSP